MIIKDKDRIKEIWLQDAIPVLFRKGTGFPLLLRNPYRDDNREWLRNKRRSKPKWIIENNYPYWKIPKIWFDDTVTRALERWQKLYIIQPYAERETCSRKCVNAKGHECECSCMGARHGSGYLGNDWFEVSETFAMTWKSAEIACRLLVVKPVSR